VHVWLTLWQVEMLVELEQANGALRSELEEKEVALAALHEELEALRAGGWADLTSENEALAAEQVRWCVGTIHTK
jgi:peptidoglycan hydrolase CwlO-like protein